MLNGEHVVLELVQHEILESPVTTYNFEVEDFHTYYVGEENVLVHNKCTRKALIEFTEKSADAVEEMDAHHVFPQKFRTRFEELTGNASWIDDPRYGAWWELHDHRRKAYAYNKEWEEFLKSNPNMDQILDFGIDISKRNGLEIYFQ